MNTLVEHMSVVAEEPPQANGETSVGADDADGVPCTDVNAVRVGVILIGHGETASHLLAAARGIVGDSLEDLSAMDAGEGRTKELEGALKDEVARLDGGRGVLLLVDLLGSSPCTCGIGCAQGHKLSVLAGLNLAMLVKLATLNRRVLTPEQLADACAESGHRSIACR